ncbi:MAG: hypothetical protein ACR2OE_05455 [Thermomicrobiales bacterium]
MSNPPFWKQNAVAGDTAPQTTTGGDNRKPGDVLNIGGHEFRWVEGVQAMVNYLDDDGKKLGTVHIPYDPENKPSEDDMLAKANRVFRDMEYMRSIVKDAAVEQLVKSIHDSGTAKEMVGMVAEVAAGSLSLNVSDEDGSDGLTSEQLEALATEGERLFNQQLPDVIGSIAENPGFRPDGSNFWQVFAREIIATATLHARDDTTETLGGPEAVEAMGGGAFEAEVLEAYRTGPFITGAMLSLTRVWTQTLAEIVGTTMTTLSESEGKAIAETLLKAARKSLGMEATPAQQNPPTATPALIPAFNADGYGRVANDMIARGARYMFVAAWPGPRTRPPEFHYRSDTGAVSYGIEQALDSLQDAWGIVDRLDDGHADLFDFILAKMLASMAARTRDTYGDFPITPGEVLNARGIKKHHKGGHRSQHIREVISQMEDLKRIQLRAEIARHSKSKRGGKPSRVSIEHAVNLIDVHETIEEVSLDGEKIPLAWNLRPGNWTRALEGFTPQYALMMQGILKLHGKRDRNAKRIGRYLIAQYRIRAYYKNWGQGYDVRTILEGAGIEIPTRNKPQFKQSIEKAFDTLADPQKMSGPVCIDSWKYSRPLDMSRSDWFECWLDTPVIILPTEKLMKEQYRGIGSKSGATRKPKKLAS